ncbi:MAG: MarR family winged helix-turn-helix transcriptional regulator [Alphaproteobacteria bacterium]
MNISAAMRAVLERLARGGPQTVPAMARTRNVSRQHIQKLVDALGEAALVDLEPNPAHKRSPLVKLTPEGQEIFATIEAREAAVITRLTEALADRDLGGTARTLRALSAALGEQFPDYAEGDR